MQYLACIGPLYTYGFFHLYYTRDIKRSQVKIYKLGWLYRKVWKLFYYPTQKNIKYQLHDADIHACTVRLHR